MNIKKHLPNAVTCCNLLSGCVACTLAFEEAYGLALSFIVLGAVFDFFDGMTARLLHVSSPMGVEMDSLADVITFGLAPSVMLFSLMRQIVYPGFLQPVSHLLPYMAFLLAAFSALRLAKFNIDTRQTTSFIGLPTPANALFWGSLVAGGYDVWMNLQAGWVLLVGLIFLFSYLLVSEIPMFSLKFKNYSWRGNGVRYLFLIVTLPMLLLGLAAAVPVILWYIVLSLIVAHRK